MFASLLILATVGADAPADPLAPARVGQLQCVNPNKEKKTCMAIATITVKPDGSYTQAIDTMINPTPLIVMQTRSSGAIEGELTCETIRKEDFAAATFTMEGTPLDPAMGDGIKAQVLGAIDPLLGKKGCTAYKPEGDLITTQVTIDGVARNEFNQKLLWIKPDEGYKVGQ